MGGVLKDSADLDDGTRLRLVAFDFYCVCDGLQLLLGFELAPSLMLLQLGVLALPAATFMHAPGLQVVDDVECDEVFLQLAFFDGLLAEGAVLAEVGPVLDADVAEGVAVWKRRYPQTIRTGSSKT
jgi:hypothetical protein